MNQEQFLQILHDVPVPKELFYRLYYSDQGDPLFYSMEDLPGNYIDIDAEFYARSPRNLKVKNGKIHMIAATANRKLVPSDHGTACHAQDVCVVVGDQHPNVKWSLKTYE